MDKRRTGYIVAGALLVLLTAGAAVAAGLTPSASVTTTVQGWEHWFHLDWTAQTKPDGEEIDGYLYSDHGQAGFNVRVLAQGLDGAGNVVGQKIEWVPGAVTGLNRAYFRITGLPRAERYRVTVWAFDLRKR